MPPKYHDKEWLMEKYITEGLDQYEIADLCGVDQATISRWFGKLDVPARPKGVSRYRVQYRTDDNGYETWRHYLAGKEHTVKVHRLVAIAERGFEAVVDRVVHHENNIPWDNRPENLELMTHSAHSELHQRLRGAGGRRPMAPWQDPDRLRDLYVNQRLSTYEVADALGCSASTVQNWLNRHGIQRRESGKRVTARSGGR